MELVERSEQLRALREALASAAAGSGRIVLLSGEAGVGKTSLLRAFMAEVGDRARVLYESCEDLSTPRTLGPFRDLARYGDLALPAVDRDTIIDTLIEQMSFAMRPTVIVVDDIHWADDASLDVVRYLVRRTPNLPAVLVLSYRDEAVGPSHPLRRIAGSLTRSEATRIPLRELSREAVARLATAAGWDPDQVIELVGGNPFYLAEVLAWPGAGVPPSVRDAVLSRLAQLPAETVGVIEVLSVVPGGAEPELAARISSGSSQLLDVALQAGVLEESGPQVRFRHELARRAVAESLPYARRIECHRLVLEALLASDADASLIVHHAAAAANDALVAAFAPPAARAALNADSYREAASFAQLALHVPANDEPAERARLHGYAARALFALGRFGEAAEHADHAVVAWDSLGKQPVELGEALLISARLSTAIADPKAARLKAERALAVLEPLGPTRELALCYATLGSQDALQAQFRTAIDTCNAAIELAEGLGLLDVRSRALCYRGISRLPLGDEGGFADLREAVRIAEQIDHGDYLTGSAHNLSVAFIRSARHTEALPYLDLAMRAARDHGLTRAQFHIEGQQCHVLLLTGQWAEAERQLRALLDGDGDLGSTVVAPLAYLSRLLARRGDPQAGTLIERAWRIAEATAEDHKQATAGAPRIELAWLRGDDAAVRRLGWWLVNLAIDVRHSYLRAEGLRYLKRIGEQVAPFDGCPAPFAAGLTGDWATAAELWAEATNPYERALELVESPDPAIAFDGLRELDQLGAVATAARVRQRLRERGVPGIPRGPRPSTRSRPGNLTARQAEILTLVGDGLTNAEIAERLVLSKRTIDNHLAAILDRLSVTSRHSAVEVARRLGSLTRA
jgi:DNA-binding CsgD family transcriptional regulator/tetratricopeptide (TPR) repeat protein